MRILVLVFIGAGLILFSPLAQAEFDDGTPKAGHSVAVHDAWTRQTSAGANGAVYFTLMVEREGGDRLISARTDRAEKVEIHQSTMDGDIMRMRAMADGLAVTSGEPLIFAPQGLHLMLIGLDKPLEVDETFNLFLEFESGAGILMAVPVKPIGYRPNNADKTGHHDQHS